jgi:hypothetical protein
MTSSSRVQASRSYLPLYAFLRFSNFSAENLVRNGYLRIEETDDWVGFTVAILMRKGKVIFGLN